MGLGSFSNLFQGEAANPWLGGLGLLAFNSLYVSVVFRGFDRRKRESPVSYWLLAAMTAVTLALAIGYGGSWLLFFPLLSLACGAILRNRQLAVGVLMLAAVATAVAVWRGNGASDPWTIGYGTFISGAVTAAILTLAETVMELRATRQELARTAVEKERLRFSRDLHDLLGHTLSVIVVKSEAAHAARAARHGRGARPGRRHRVRRPSRPSPRSVRRSPATGRAAWPPNWTGPARR